MGPRRVVEVAGRPVVLVDSVSYLDAADRGAVVVSASHGGTSAAVHALAVAPAAIAFNDAGVGKDAAGIRALGILAERAIAAVTVAHTSARIGDADDHWSNGVVSHVNPVAADGGVEPGMSVREAFARLIARRPPP